MAFKRFGCYDKFRNNRAVSIFSEYFFHIQSAQRQINCKFSTKNLRSELPFGRFTQYNVNKYPFISLRNFASYPDHIKVTLPALSPTMEKGNIQSWSKKEGDEIKEGDSLAEIETDKAVLPLETIEGGYLAKILLPAGIKDVPVGKLMCIMVKNQGDIGAFKDFKDDSAPMAAAAAPAPAPAPAPPPAPVQHAAPAPAPAPAPSAPTSPGDRAYASPMATKLAEAQSLRLSGKGSGVHQSIKSTDLAGMKKGSPAAAAAPSAKGIPSKARAPNTYKDIPVSGIRDVIGRRLLESKTTIPHFYVTVECKMDNIMTLREKVNKEYKKEGIRVSVNDFVIKATATACMKVPETNSHWMGKVIRQFEHCDVSVAVSTDTGLITPIIFSADEKGIFEISSDMKKLAKKARSNALKPAEYQGGSVCISNMGMMGVDLFCAIINPPQTLILAIGHTRQKFVPDKNPKGFSIINVMYVTASADHRVVDGAVCARWLQHFRNFIEEPGSMLL